MNEHWTVRFADGTHAFIKQGDIDPSPQWIRDERDVFAALDGPFMPRFLAFEDGDAPLLVLEDLMPARWPPPWQDGDVGLVLATLAEVAAANVTASLPRLEDVHANEWRDVERDPEPFLATRLRDAAWLERNLQRLIAAADAAPRHGDSLVHCDVRSDNLCLKDGRAVLVDWNH